MKWMPIETAPEDEFILVCEENFRMGGAYFEDGEWVNDQGDVFDPVCWIHIKPIPRRLRMKRYGLWLLRPRTDTAQLKPHENE